MKIAWELSSEDMMDLLQMVYDLAEQGDPVAENKLEHLGVTVDVPVHLWNSGAAEINFSMPLKELLTVYRHEGMGVNEFMRERVQEEIAKFIAINFDDVIVKVEDTNA